MSKSTMPIPEMPEGFNDKIGALDAKVIKHLERIQAQGGFRKITDEMTNIGHQLEKQGHLQYRMVVKSIFYYWHESDPLHSFGKYNNPCRIGFLGTFDLAQSAQNLQIIGCAFATIPFQGLRPCPECGGSGKHMTVYLESDGMRADPPPDTPQIIADIVKNGDLILREHINKLIRKESFAEIVKLVRSATRQHKLQILSYRISFETNLLARNILSPMQISGLRYLIFEPGYKSLPDENTSVNTQTWRPCERCTGVGGIRGK